MEDKNQLVFGEVISGCDIYEMPKWGIRCMSEDHCTFDSAAATKAEARHIARMHQLARHKLNPGAPEFKANPELEAYR